MGDGVSTRDDKPLHKNVKTRILSHKGVLFDCYAVMEDLGN